MSDEIRLDAAVVGRMHMIATFKFSTPFPKGVTPVLVLAIVGGNRLRAEAQEARLPSTGAEPAPGGLPNDLEALPLPSPPESVRPPDRADVGAAPYRVAAQSEGGPRAPAQIDSLVDYLVQGFRQRRARAIKPPALAQPPAP